MSFTNAPLKIGIFDSGLGGLSILRALHSSYPHVVFDYCCDQENFPYGTKSGEDIIKFSSRVVSKFVAEAKLDGVVIACGTASTIVLPHLREQLNIPVVGVVPAIKPAAEQTKTHHIGLLATEATVRRPYIKDLVNEHARSCQVELLGSRLLVELAEQKMRGEPVDLQLIAAEIKPLIYCSDLDTIVLGCTHFPLLEPELRAVAPSHVQFLDSSLGIVKRLGDLFGDRLKQSNQKHQTLGQGYTTKVDSDLVRGGQSRIFADIQLTSWRVIASC